MLTYRQITYLLDLLRDEYCTMNDRVAEVATAHDQTHPEVQALYDRMAKNQVIRATLQESPVVIRPPLEYDGIPR